VLAVLDAFPAGVVGVIGAAPPFARGIDVPGEVSGLPWGGVRGTRGTFCGGIGDLEAVGVSGWAVGEAENTGPGGGGWGAAAVLL